MKTSGHTILITGGTSGIGLGFAEEFLKRANKVIICGRREDRLKRMKEKYPSIICYKCDVTDASQRINMAEWVISNYPEMNMLMNNAGIQLMSNIKNPDQLSKIQTEVETNMIAPIHLISLFTNHLASKKDSYIINISSGLAFTPLAFMPVYCATKAAIHSISLSLRYQLKDTSTKVFEIIPPAVDTELGLDRRQDKNQFHGGISVSEFIAESMKALENDEFEAAIGQAQVLRDKSQEMFSILNK